MSNAEIPEHEAAFQRRAQERAAAAAAAHHQRQVEAERARVAHECDNAARASAKEAAKAAGLVFLGRGRGYGPATPHDTEPAPATSRSPQAIATSPSDDPTTATTITADDPGALRGRGRRRP